MQANRADDLFEPNAGNQLHAQEPLIGRLVDFFGIDLDDVGVFEPGHRAALAAAIRGDLERDFPVERELASKIDVPKRSAAEHPHDFEVVDLLARRQRRRPTHATHGRPGDVAGRRRGGRGAETGRRAGRVVREPDVSPLARDFGCK